MLRHNLFACVRDTRAGVRRSRQQRSSSARFSESQGPDGVDRSSKSMSSNMQDSTAGEPSGDQSGHSGRSSSKHQPEGETDLDASRSQKYATYPVDVEAKSGEHSGITYGPRQEYPQGAQDSAENTVSSQYPTMSSQTRIPVIIPRRSSSRGTTYLAEDKEEYEDNEGEATFEDMDTSAHDVLKRAFKRGSSVRFSGISPMEDDVPRRLSRRFSQGEVLEERAPEAVATSPEVETVGGIHVEADKNDLDRDVETDENVAPEEINSSGRDGSTRRSRNHSGVNIRIGGRAPTLDDMPRRLSKKFSQNDILQKGTTETIVTESAQAIGRNPGKEAGKRNLANDAGMNGRGTSGLRDQEPEKTQHGSTTSESCKVVDSNLRPYLGARSASFVDSSAQHSAHAWQRPLTVDLPRRNSSRGPLFSTAAEEQHDFDASETFIEGMGSSDGVSTSAPRQRIGPIIRIGGRGPMQDDIPRRLSRRFSQHEILHERSSEFDSTEPGTAKRGNLDLVTGTGALTRDGETNGRETSSHNASRLDGGTQSGSMGHSSDRSVYHDLEADKPQRDSMTDGSQFKVEDQSRPSLAARSASFVDPAAQHPASAWQRPMTVDLPRRSSGRGAIFSMDNDEDHNANTATDTAVEGIASTDIDVAAPAPNQGSGVRTRIDGMGPMMGDLRRRLSRTFSQQEVSQQKTAENVATQAAMPLNRDVDPEEGTG